MSDQAMSAVTVTDNVLNEVLEERQRQDDLWGEQNYPVVYNENERRAFGRSEEKWQAVNAARVRGGSLHWDGLLVEEVMEALSTFDIDVQRAEFIQVAAVAVAAVESIDRTIASMPERNEPGDEGDDDIEEEAA